MDNIKTEHISSTESASYDQIFKQKAENPLQQKSRRSRSDNLNREYNCGCGKSYLSAAALYTHVKQKHQGIQPKGSQNPKGGKHHSKKQNEQEALLQDEFKSVTREFNHSSLTSSSVYDDITNFFSKKISDPINQKVEDCCQSYEWILDIFPRHFFKNGTDYFVILQQLESLIKQIRQSEDPSTVSKSSSQTLQSCTKLTSTQQNEKPSHSEGEKTSQKNINQQNWEYKIEANAISNNQNNENEIENRFCIQNDSSEENDENEEDNNQLEDFYDFQRELRVTSINRIICIFIINISSKVSPTALSEILVFLTLLHKALNEKGWENCTSLLPHKQFSKQRVNNMSLVKLEDERQWEEDGEYQEKLSHFNSDKQEEFCSVNCGELVAEIANVFISECLPIYLQNEVANSQELKLISSNEEGTKNSCLMLQLFQNWMFAYKFSSGTLAFSWEEEQQAKEYNEQLEGHSLKKKQFIQNSGLHHNEYEQNCDNYSQVSYLPENLQHCLQKSSESFMDRIKSSDDLIDSRDQELNGNTQNLFEEGVYKSNQQKQRNLHSNRYQSAANSTTYAPFQSCNNSTSYARGGSNSTTFFHSQNNMQSGNNRYNLINHSKLGDYETARLSSQPLQNPFLCNPSFSQASNVYFGANSSEGYFPFIAHPSLINSSQQYYKQLTRFDYNMQSNQIFYSQNPSQANYPINHLQMQGETF